MRIPLITLFLTAVFFACVSAQGDGEKPKFYAEASSTEIAPGETFEISFVLENLNGGQLTPPEWDSAGFDLVGGPGQSSSVSIANGVRHSEIRYTYFVQARDTGLVLVPSATLHDGAKEIKTEPLELHVSGQAPPSTWRRSTKPPRNPTEPPAEKPNKPARPTVRI